MYFSYMKRSQNKGPNKNQIKGKQTKIALSVKVSSLSRGSIDIRVVLGWLSTGIIFHIDILGASLKKRASCSSKVKIDRAKVNFWEVFHSICPEVLKTCCVILV